MTIQAKTGDYRPLSEWDSIVLAGLRCSGHLGCSTEERRRPQVIFLTLTLYLDTRPAATSDNLAQTINYSQLSKALVELVSKANCQLIETLAARIAQYCLAEYPLCQAVRVQIDKPAGLPDAEGASLNIYRQRTPETV